MLIVTTDLVPGYEIVQVYGEVFGLSFRRGIMPGFLAQGTEDRRMIQQRLQGKAEATSRMVADAERRGANAIVGMRIDTDLGPYGNEILVYGTAVVIESGTQGGSPQ